MFRIGYDGVVSGVGRLDVMIYALTVVFGRTKEDRALLGAYVHAVRLGNEVGSWWREKRVESRERASG